MRTGPTTDQLQTPKKGTAEQVHQGEKMTDGVSRDCPCDSRMARDKSREAGTREEEERPCCLIEQGGGVKVVMGFEMYPAAALALVGPPSFHVQVIRHTSALPPCSFGSSRLRWQDDSIGHSVSRLSRRGPARWKLRPPAAAAADAGAEYERRLDNPRRPVPNEYLAGWALTQNDTACLQRFQDMGYTDCGNQDSSPEEARGEKAGFCLWGEATGALMDRVDIVRDLDQRRLAASRYWQRLQSTPPKEAPTSNTSNTDIKGKTTDLDPSPGLAAPTWADVDALFESDDGFVRQESERYIEEAREGMPSEGGWSGDRVSRQWVASYRLSVFETRRQAQRFFSWGIPDEEALDCILEPGKRVLEVGSGLGYWAYLLKLRSGDDSRVRCFDPFAPPARHRTEVSNTEGGSGYSVEEAQPRSIENAPSPEQTSVPEEEEEVDDWFGEGREPFSPAERGSFDRIAREDGFRDWSLLICWPSDGHWPAGCLQEFAGDDFFYVGEGEGGATRMPWRVLREEWELVRRVEIPTWPGFRDALWWYRRKQPESLSPDR